MNLFQGDTAAISALASDLQGDRLLRLSFPHNDGPASAFLLANRLLASESLSHDFAFEVEVLSDDATLPLTELMGRLVSIALVREDGTLRYFTGYVFAFRLVKTDGGFAFYTMHLGPWLQHLHLRKNSATYQNLRLEELTAGIFAAYPGYQWRSQLSGGDAPVTYRCQHNESDHNFLHRLWEAHGWFHYTEHDADGHTLFLCDDSTTTAPIDGAVTSMPYQHQAGAIEDDGVHAWSPLRRMAPSSMSLASFDFKVPRTTRVEAASLNRQGAVPPLEVYENTGSYGYQGYADGDAQARLRMEEIDASGQVYEARGNDRTAQPGRWFTLSGHFGDAPQTEYLIVSVQHTASNNYQDGSGAASSYSNQFSCVERSVPWRPGRGRNSYTPRIYGVQTATVVGPPGEDIHTDGHGRIKVQFHWDRHGTSDDSSSPWIRVVSPWAGANFGHISLPRVGMEVVISFLDGNIDHPLVVGCLYNASHMPPWDLPANKTQSGMLTRSSRQGTPAHANALRFEDRKGAEELWLHAEKDQRIEVEHDESHWVGNDRCKTVDRDETVQVKRDRTETVGHDEKITVHHNRSERVDQDEHIDIGANRSEVVGGNETIRIRGMQSEHVDQMKTETVVLAKTLTIGGLYGIAVGAAMNTLVTLSQFAEILVNKVTKVGKKYNVDAGEEFEVTVGKASLSMKQDGSISLSGSDIRITASGPIQINGKDVDIN